MPKCNDFQASNITSPGQHLHKPDTPKQEQIHKNQQGILQTKNVHVENAHKSSPLPTRNLINATTLTGICTSNSIHLSSKVLS